LVEAELADGSEGGSVEETSSDCSSNESMAIGTSTNSVEAKSITARLAGSPIKA
jgi:hypothetical protein